MLDQQTDVVIIGGGVIGLSIARALAIRDVGVVTLIERASLGSESSSAAAGMLAPQAEADSADEFFQLCCRSRDLYGPFAEALFEETGIDVELDAAGTLYLALNDHDLDEIERRYKWQTQAGHKVEKLSAVEARYLEPCISDQTQGALRFPQDIQVENRRLVSALVTSSSKLGVRLLTGTLVESVRIDRDRVRGVETSNCFINAPTVVVAGGAWTSFIRGSDQSLPTITIEPVRGQMLSFEANPNICRHVIYSPRGYIVPRRNGRLLAGSTTEHTGFDKSVTAGGMHAVLSHALEIAPEITNLRLIDSWAGLRPRAPDNLPVLGPCAGIEGLIYATGHYRNGILLAPITAELIAGVVAEKVVSPLLGAFAPDRFDLVGVS